MKITLIIIAWLICATLSYVMMRSHNRKAFKHFIYHPAWSKQDRAFFLTGSIVLGPIAFLSSLICWLSSIDDKTEAKW